MKITKNETEYHKIVRNIEVTLDNGKVAKILYWHEVDNLMGDYDNGVEIVNSSDFTEEEYDEVYDFINEEL